MIRVTTLLCCALLFGAAACKHPQSAVGESFGDAYRQNRDAMIANPAAGAQDGPEGLDPRSAEHVLENYSKGQKAQEHPRAKDGGTGVILGEIK